MSERNRLITGAAAQVVPGQLGQNINKPADPVFDSLPITDQFSIDISDMPLGSTENPIFEAAINSMKPVNNFVTPSGLPRFSSNEDGTNTPQVNIGELIQQNAPEYRGEYDLPSFKKEPIPNAPKILRFSTADTGFDRYYAHPKFAEIGFVPYESRTEDIYNANSVRFLHNDVFLGFRKCAQR